MYNTYTMSFVRRIKKGDAVYLAEVENRRVDGKVVQRHLRYIGRDKSKAFKISRVVKLTKLQESILKAVDKTLSNL